jgi:integrase
MRDLDGEFGVDTYKQYQRAGRRLIDRFTGELNAAAERRARTDAWAVLIARLDDLAATGLIARGRVSTVKSLADIARRVGLLPKDLLPDQIDVLRAAIRHSSEWDKVLKALRFLDSVRVHALLGGHLPAAPFGQVETKWRRVFVIPPSVGDQIDVWVDRAAREQIEDARFAHLAAPRSEDYRARLTAALRNYCYTAEETGEVCLADTACLSELFKATVIDATVGHWIEISSKPGGLSLGSIADYCSDLLVLLSRNGFGEFASYLAGLCDVHRDIRAGRIQRKTMSQKNQAWCRALLADEKKIEIFDTQHFLYWEEAKQALAEARAANLDLKDLVASNRIEKLPKKTRSIAKGILRRVRMFGTCAAFAAIELEGAPFRKTNTLDLMRDGPKQTFFDHSDHPDPHFTIIIPNELLKNGDALTRRGEELPPIEIRDISPSDRGYAIMRWFIDEIRPLFPGSDTSAFLFPSCGGGSERLAERTFDTWLYLCSSAVKLPLTPHNFRHGYVSIQYAADRSSLGDLAIILGDTESTLRRYYRFIDRSRTAREIQDSVRSRREARHGAWRPVPMRRAA